MNKLYVHNVRKPKNSNVKAYADVTIGNAITLSNIKLIEGEKGEFVAMPSRKYEKDGENKYIDIFYPKSEEAGRALFETFQKAYESKDGYAYLNGDVNPDVSVTVHSIPVRDRSSSLRAWATLNVGNDFVVRNIAVNETSKGLLMVNFPSVKYEKDGETKFWELVTPKKAEWTDRTGNACSKDYGKLICGLIINAYKPTLSEQIDSADKTKNKSVDTEKDNPNRFMESVVK